MDTNKDILTMASLNEYVTLVDHPNESRNIKTNSKEDKWQVVGDNKKEKQRIAVNEDISYKFLPKTLFPEYIHPVPHANTSKIIALNIKIRPDKENKMQLNKSRIVVAVMRALQNIHPDTYLATINDRHPIEHMIVDTVDIPIDDNDLANYLITAEEERQFLGKIFVHTNTELMKYKTSIQFRNYLGKENMVVEENRLNCIKPANVGFLETTIARNETTDFHTNRLIKHLPKDIPSFQINVSSLYVRTGLRCRVLMIRTHPDNVARIQEEFNKLNEKKIISFFHWGEYLSLTTEQQEDIINHQNKWYSNIRSILLPGFTDYAVTLPMQTKDNPTMIQQNPDCKYLLNTTITEYFKNHVYSGNGSKLFAYVYTPIDGTYKFLVKVNNESEAKDYLKSAIGELSKRMSEDVINKVFYDPEAAIKTVHLAPWRPYTRCTKLLPELMPTGECKNDSINGKRLRYETSYLNKNPNSYSSMITNTTIRQDSVSVLSNESNSINNIYKRLDEIQRTMDEKIQAHINRNNEKTMQLIEERNEEMKTELTTKIDLTISVSNTVLTNITSMMMPMQAEQRESNRNIGTIMNHFNNIQAQNIGFSSDMRNESIELSFVSEMKDTEPLLDTPVKNKVTHNYNTRSTASSKMHLDEYYDTTQPETITTLDIPRDASAVTKTGSK